MAEATTIRVLIVDDHVLVRKGIMALLSEVEGMAVVGEASDGQQAIEAAVTLSPDVVLMDLLMPGVDGIEATRQVKARCPNCHILVLTSFAADEKILPAIKAGALGYLLKDSSPAELVRAIQQVYRGEPSLQPAIARKLLRELSRPQTELPPAPEPLTARELEVLALLARGLSNQQIAGRLDISEATVRSHVSNTLSKLHLANRVQATLYALREGLVPLPGDAEGGE